MESAQHGQPSDALVSYVDSLRLGRDVVNLMLRGRSVIDANQGLPLRTEEAADEFLFRYGYNLDNPVERAEVYGNYHEALRFIRKYFLKPENADGADLEIPRVFMELTDMRQLFVWASDRSLADVNRSRWACSVLRVMHAISHLDKDLRHDYFPEIQKQVFDRFYKEIHSEGEVLYLGDPRKENSVRLEKFQTKPRKARDSVILKILHKKETLAEDVFDQIGVRFVTETRVDVVRVLKYLRDRYIVMSMNIRPSRSRNNLVDPLLYRRRWRTVKQAVMRGEVKDEEKVKALLESSLSAGFMAAQREIAETNPFSLTSFQSIQFTCRQLVKYRHPEYEDVKNLRAYLKTNSEDQEVHALLDRLDLSRLAKEQRFFYPFEVQIMDAENFREAESGQASHAVYKAAQTKTAMKRVLKQLLPEE